MAVQHPVNANQMERDLNQANGGNNQENRGVISVNEGGNQENGRDHPVDGDGNQGDGNMAANNVPGILPYTTDEDFAEIRDKDKHVEAIGYVDEIHASSVVGRLTKYDLFKFVLSNGSTSRITCLVWGLPLIQKHVGSIAIGTIIHIEGATSKSAVQDPPKNNLVGMELLIKEATSVTELGRHVALSPEAVVPTEFTTVELAETEKSRGVEGYIKIKFYRTEPRFNPEFGGVGCITDDQYKITINVSNYQEIHFEKGIRVRVIGTVDTSGAGPVSITCLNDLCVTEVEGALRMSAVDVSRGNKTPKRGRD